jgi:hypothetical protein
LHPTEAILAITRLKDRTRCLHLQPASGNTGIGGYALFSDTTGVFNTAMGTNAMRYNSTGSNNTAIGISALFSNTTGTSNTATGAKALQSNTSGISNTAHGTQALRSNTTGDGNTATGFAMLWKNTTGVFNTASGYAALSFNTSGFRNTTNGSEALESNGTGVDNTANGNQALSLNTSGSNNTADGSGALIQSSIGSFNTAVGVSALFFSATGNNNTALGYLAGHDVTSASDVTCIGASVLGANVSNSTWMGNVYNVITQNGTTAPVIASADGQLGTVASSERFNKDIAPMEKNSEAILLLRPVTFHYKSDAKETPQFGLIAEEVAKVSPALVLPDKEGKPYTVRYEAVNAMLLNEFLNEHRRVQERGAIIARLQKQIDALTAGLQKVSAQLGVNKSAPQLAASHQ